YEGVQTKFKRSRVVAKLLDVATKDGKESHNRNLQAILTNGVVSCSTLSDQEYAEDFYDQ
nr:hypothetical protein [Tanacetum cinerariifolium]